jgi:hypothetical protein
MYIDSTCSFQKHKRFFSVPSGTNFIGAKNCFEVSGEKRDRCWVDQFINPQHLVLCRVFNERPLHGGAGMNSADALNSCIFGLIVCANKQQWIANTETAYFNYQVSEYKKELHALAIESAKNATGDKKVAADRLVAQLGVCLKATNDKEQVRQCYVKFRDTYMAL